MSTEIQADPAVDRQAYQRAVKEFDRLWAYGSSPQDQSEMARLMRIIETYEAAQACRCE